VSNLVAEHQAPSTDVHGKGKPAEIWTTDNPPAQPVTALVVNNLRA
jgi:hypothetical protein